MRRYGSGRPRQVQDEHVVAQDVQEVGQPWDAGRDQTGAHRADHGTDTRQGGADEQRRLAPREPPRTPTR